MPYKVSTAAPVKRAFINLQIVWSRVEEVLRKGCPKAGKIALRKSWPPLAKHKTFQILKKGLGAKVGRTQIGVMMDVVLHVN